MSIRFHWNWCNELPKIDTIELGWAENIENQSQC